MKVLGFLFVFALFGEQKKSYFDNVKDFSVETETVGQLESKLFNSDTDSDGPVFTEEDIRKSNFVNKGNVAKYYSKAVRDYIVYHNVSSEEDGFVVTLYNDDNPKVDTEDTIPEEEEAKTPTVIFLPNKNVDLKDIEEESVQTAISQYLDTVQEKIDSGEIGVIKSDVPSHAILEVNNKSDHLSVQPSTKNVTSVIEELSNLSDHIEQKDIEVTENNLNDSEHPATLDIPVLGSKENKNNNEKSIKGLTLIVINDDEFCDHSVETSIESLDDNSIFDVDHSYIFEEPTDSELESDELDVEQDDATT